MEIIDDYLKFDYFTEIYKKYTTNKVKWEYVNVANPSADYVGMFSFNNMLYDIRMPTNTIAKELQYLLKDNMKLIRAKANLFTIRDESIKYGWHYDLVQENNTEKHSKTRYSQWATNLCCSYGYHQYCRVQHSHILWAHSRSKCTSICG